MDRHRLGDHLLDPLFRFPDILSLALPDGAQPADGAQRGLYPDDQPLPASFPQASSALQDRRDRLVPAPAPASPFHHPRRGDLPLRAYTFPVSVGRASMQDLTPLEIQKQTFSKKFKGYEPAEVHGYLNLVAEEIERLVKDVDRLSRENAMLREELEEHSQRERILKDTLLSAQKGSEEVKANARKEGELIVKDAELLSERLVSQAMARVADLERAIQDLKMERRQARNKLTLTLDTIQQLLMLDAEQEANEHPITSMYRKSE